MNSITTPPNSVTQAGLDFNYSVWTPGTTVQLCNVPWTNDYRDIVEFNTRAQLDDYLTQGAGPVVTFTQTSYAKPGNPVNISLPFNAAYKYNYLRVSNPAQPIQGDQARTFYYFITNVTYVAPNTTQLQLQLDVWQTFFTEVEFGRCYVERGHIGIANDNADLQNGRAYLTIPEGLDTGNEYAVQEVQTRKLIEEAENNAVNQCSVVIVSTIDVESSGGDVSSPYIVTAKGMVTNGVPSGAYVYFLETVSDLQSFLQEFADKPWVTQGIIACYMVPPLSIADVQGMTLTIPNVTGKRMSGYPKTRTLNMKTNWRESMKYMIPERYRHLTKFLTYPYSFIELTLYNGMPIVLKPECVTTTNLEVEFSQFLSPPNPRLMVYPKRYNDFTENPGLTPEQYLGEYLDFATGIINLPQISIVNNGYLSYMAANTNQISFQHRHADWSQQRALHSAQTGYNQASGFIGLNETLNRLSVQAATDSTELTNRSNLYRAGIGAAGSIGMGARAGGAIGAGMGAAQGMLGAAEWGISSNQNTQQTAINNALATSRTRESNQQAAMVRDTNKDFADWAAKGDYENAIAGINARVQDAQMIQPTTSGQVGGEAFNFSVQDGYVLTAKFKTVDPARISMIGEYWLRYGYAVNRFMSSLDRLKVMSRFSYWKLKEMYLSSSTCPETFRQTIRGIFEKGVTVWSDPDDIANVDVADNVPYTGIVIA